MKELKYLRTDIAYTDIMELSVSVTENDIKNIAIFNALSIKEKKKLSSCISWNTMFGASFWKYSNQKKRYTNLFYLLLLEYRKYIGMELLSVHYEYVPFNINTDMPNVLPLIEKFFPDVLQLSKFIINDSCKYYFHSTHTVDISKVGVFLKAPVVNIKAYFKDNKLF